VSPSHLLIACILVLFGYVQRFRSCQLCLGLHELDWLIVSPLPCTGAGVDLVTKAGADVVGCGCVIELPELKGRDKLGEIPLFIMVEKEDTEGGLA